MKEYLQKERPTKNVKKEYVEQIGFYNTKKEMEREMAKHRRDLLTQVANIYKKEKSDFYQKYRLF